MQKLVLFSLLVLIAGTALGEVYAQTTPEPEPSDVIPPTLNIPENFTVAPDSIFGTTIVFSVSAVDDVDGAILPVCVPASPAFVNIGTTTVTCTATDTAGNVAEASFDVTVNNLLTILEVELLTLGELDPSNVENVGTHVSDFVRTSNILFQLEQQGLKDLRTEYRESGMTRSELNQELSQYRITIQDMRQDYQEIFENYRDTVKQLVKEKNGLSVEDKRNLQQLEKAKLQIRHNNIESLDTLDSFIDDSLYQELKINENKLRKLNNLIALSNYPLTVYSDSQVAKWKQEQIELFSTVKALKIVLSGADKDSKSDILSTIKEIKNQIKDEKQKEQKQKENNSKKNSDKGKSEEKSKKSSNKGKKK